MLNSSIDINALIKSLDEIIENALNIPVKNIEKNSYDFCLFSLMKLWDERIINNPDINIIILNAVV